MPFSHPLSKQASGPPWYYRLVIIILKPLYRMQVWQRSHKRDNYQQEVAQRFGHHYPPRPVASTDQINHQANRNDLHSNNLDSNALGSNELAVKDKVIWCHAVSLGETNTAAPLLDALLAKGYQIWLTNTTQTGFARGASRFASEIAQGRMSHSYVPVDTPAVIERFLAHVQPIAALFIETELWANILHALAQRGIASILVNGRLSATSFTRYQKIRAVSMSMMYNLTLIIAQDNDSAKRFRELGAASTQIRVAGSLKWVINTPKMDNIKDESGESIVVGHTKTDSIDKSAPHLNRPIWVAASTHGGEEEIALAWQKQLLASPTLKETLLIIVPRHPERFDEVATLIEQSDLQMARRSQNEPITAQTQVYLADTMGELMHWYAQADVALVAGSLVDIGGHNPVEPASVATPVLMGKYTQSCQSVVDQLAGIGALYQPHNNFYQPITKHTDNENTQNPDTDNIELSYQQLQFWLNHPKIAKQAGQAGKQLTEQQQSALSCQLAMIEAVIEESMLDKSLSCETL